MERNAKQIIVMRKDLNMRRGKQIAQGAHSVLKAIIDPAVVTTNESGKIELTITFEPGTALDAWLTGNFTKICVSVNSLEELYAVYNQAREAKLITAIITDAGLTEFGGKPTVTCCAIGPAWADELQAITGHLPLL